MLQAALSAPCTPIHPLMLSRSQAAFPLSTCGRPRLSPGPAAPTGGQRDPIRGRGQLGAAAAPPSPRTRRRDLTTAPRRLNVTTQPVSRGY